MIKIKNSQLNTETINSINKLIEMDINASIAFRLVRVIRELSTIIEDKIKMERKILDKWIEKGENGEIIRPTGDNGEVIKNSVKITNNSAFNEEMNLLMQVENEIDFNQVSFDELGLKTVKIKDIMKIDFLFI